jgi:hypothetical protein
MPLLKRFPGPGPGPVLAALALMVLAALVMGPALHAGFLQDDWDFLASSAHLPSPLPYFLENHSRGYFYRPNGMLVWWLMNQAAGPAPAWHYALQILVHAGCALAVLGLARRLGASLPAAFGAAIIFVAHPATAATSLWLSNRFDLLAALGLLMGMGLLFSPRPGRPLALLGLAACTWLAVGAKEIGLLVVPLTALALWLRPELAPRVRVGAALAVALPVLAWFLLRVSVLDNQDVAASWDPGVLANHFVTGVAHWLRHLPAALALDQSPWLGGIVLAAVVGSGLAGLRGGRQDGAARRAWIGLGLLLLPPLLQWPITHFTLAPADALAVSVSLRFYFVSLCGAALLLSIALDGWPAPDADHGRFRARGATVLIVAALIASPLVGDARQRSLAWTADTANPQTRRMEAALVSRFRASAGGAGCKLAFIGATGINLPGFADHIAKAHLPRGHIAFDSLVLTDPMPWSAIVGPAGAHPAALAPLRNRMAGPIELAPAPVGPLIYVSLDFDSAALADSAGCSPLSFHWDGTDFVPSPHQTPPPSTSPRP